MKSRRRSWAERITAACLFLILLLPGAEAQQTIPWHSLFWSESFGTFDATRYYTGRNSYYDPVGGRFVLTSEKEGEAGRLFLRRLRSPEYFTATFRMHLGYYGSMNHGGADGIVFTLAPLYDYPFTDGGSLDFDGCQGYGIEFDTYLNSEKSDPTEEHIAVVSGDTKNHLAVNTNLAGRLETGAWHDAEIRMRNGRVDVTLDSVIYISYTIPDFDPAEKYFGFTSATGKSFNEHLLDDIRILVPSSVSTHFGTLDLCEARRRDTVLVLVNNTLLPVNITDVEILDILDPGAYSVIGFSPLTLQPGDSAQVTVRLDPTFPGDKLSILKFSSSNGEYITDTLRAVATAPFPLLSDSSLTFPATHVGFSAERRITLLNGGSAPLRIDSAMITGAFSQRFILLAPTLPAVVPPGGNIELRIRFAPGSDSMHTATLFLFNSCVSIPQILLTGYGRIRNLNLAFPIDTAIAPFRRIRVPLRLLDSPAGTGILGFSGDLRYNPAVLRVRSIDKIGTLTDPYALTNFDTAPGLTRIEASGSDTLTSDGILFEVEFESIDSDTGCSVIDFNRFDFNHLSNFPGVPRSTVTSGWICVSPSCRTPEGVASAGRSVTGNLQVAPNPISAGGGAAYGGNPATRISFIVGQAGEHTEWRHIVLRLVDLLGREAALIFDGDLTPGEHTLHFHAGRLPSGNYFLVLTDGDVISTLPVLIAK